MLPFSRAYPVGKRHSGLCAESRKRPAAIGAVCSQCHAIGPAPAKFNRAQSFASIAAKEKITSEMIASFLRLPHATMPNVPLSRKDAQDIAAFIMDMKK
jgi:mono/diheme cytochrome c family protein